MVIQTLYIGGWFQRTTLHLTEIWNFLNEQAFDPYVSGVPTDVSPSDIRKVVASLDIASLSREINPLEYVLLTTTSGIVCRIYEDGLIVLEKPVTSLKADKAAIQIYYETKLSKAFSLLFGKGAPVPKELAGIKSVFPFIVAVSGAKKQDVEEIFSKLSSTIHSSVSAKKVQLYRGHEVVVINNVPHAFERDLIEAEIFFREFKTQLHRYLGIHRQLWENIAKIKERSHFNAAETTQYRSELADYQRTINLIDARIDQMGAYVRTRQKIVSLQKIDAYPGQLLDYKFETLLDTHEYIRYLWDMTQNYLNATIAIFDGLQARATQKAVSSLQLVTLLTAMNVVLLALGKKDVVFGISTSGALYVLLLVAAAVLVQKIISAVSRRQAVRLKPENLSRLSKDMNELKTIKGG